jgi:hypothetical protein
VISLLKRLKHYIIHKVKCVTKQGIRAVNPWWDIERWCILYTLQHVGDMRKEEKNDLWMGEIRKRRKFFIKLAI